MRPKQVLLTVNPDLVSGKRVSTIRSLATALDKICDLKIIPIDGYDFAAGTVQCFKRLSGGQFQYQRKMKPKGDLWIVYSDGYWIDTAKLGYSRRLDYLRDQMAMHQNALDSGSINTLVNSTASEKATLKDWFVGMDPELFNIIPTFRAKSHLDLHDLLKRNGTIVAKPTWGGAGQGVTKITSDAELKAFIALLNENPDTPLKDFCFQTYKIGAEKRLWFLGDEFTVGRIAYSRKTPWSKAGDDFHAHVYDLGTSSGFTRDLANAKRIWKHSGLQIGCVDFLGSKINEINGCGTLFTYYDHWETIVDARERLVKYATTLVDQC